MGFDVNTLGNDTDEPLSTRRGEVNYENNQLMHSTGTIQEMNESKEISNGNNSLQNSMDKL